MIVMANVTFDMFDFSDFSFPFPLGVSLCSGGSLCGGNLCGGSRW